MNFGFIDTDLIFRTALVFLRTGALLFALPIFGETIVPVKTRVFISLSLALIIVPMLSQSWNVSHQGNRYWSNRRPSS